MALERWLPLESNPDVLNKYAYGIGMPEAWKFVDVYGLDADLLAIVPQPVLAVVLLYPSTKNSEEILLGTVSESAIKELYFMKQSDTIGNACGTVALIHALANNTDTIDLKPASTLKDFLSRTKEASPEERASILENCHDMGSAHEESAQEGQTDTPARDESVDYHFVAFIHKDGCLFEMDGMKGGPVYHSVTCEDSFLVDAAGVVKKFMERDPDELNFTVMALVDSLSLL
ncbi:ubiquitin carboxyl-terminal hydrolase-like isoform X2 [Liolophura sinensis]